MLCKTELLTLDGSKHNRMLTNTASKDSYFVSGSPDFKSQLGDRLSWLRIFIVIFRPSCKCQQSTLN
jgi:hypothetical protein